MELSVIRPAADISIDIRAWPIGRRGQTYLGWVVAGYLALVAAALL